MIADGNLAEVAALLGDAARANMMVALLDGRALTAGELAYAARVSPPTASAHLAKLAAARLVVALPQGRHRYYRLASPHVARMIESVMVVAALDAPPRHRPRSPGDDALRLARTCYDHLAGRLGVALADALAADGRVVLSEDGGEVTAAGRAFLHDFGVACGVSSPRGPRAFCRPCLDWTERRPHLAGVVGKGLAERCFALGWIERRRDGRAVRITPKGEDGLRAAFGFEAEAGALKTG